LHKLCITEKRIRNPYALINGKIHVIDVGKVQFIKLQAIVVPLLLKLELRAKLLETDQQGYGQVCSLKASGCQPC